MVESNWGRYLASTSGLYTYTCVLITWPHIYAPVHTYAAAHTHTWTCTYMYNIHLLEKRHCIRLSNWKINAVYSSFPVALLIRRTQILKMSFYVVCQNGKIKWRLIIASTSKIVGSKQYLYNINRKELCLWEIQYYQSNHQI